MKQHIYHLAGALVVASSLFAADNNTAQAIKHYQASEFAPAIPLLKQAIKAEQDTQLNRSRLAQCLAAQALEEKDNLKFVKANNLFVESDQVYQPGDGDQIVAVSDQGFGDTIQFAYYLKQLNDCGASIHLHLPGIQRFLKAMLERSNVTTTITTGELQRNKDLMIVPLIATVAPDHLFAGKKPYLVPKPEAVSAWQEKIDTKRLNIATAWRSGDKPVLGGRMLYRDVPLKAIIDLARTVDANAHVYLVQGPPHRFVLQSEFHQMNEQDQATHRLNVIPDDYQHYITVVEEKNGPFEDTLAVLTKCIYIGSDTVIPHMSGNVKHGQAVIILPPKNKDGTSNRDWRWMQGNAYASQTEGEVTPWYSGDKVRIFELNPHEQKQLAPVVALLTKWHQQRQKKNN